MVTTTLRMMRMEAETSQMERDHLDLLLNISKFIMSELELNKLLRKIMDLTRDVLRADRCSVYLLDKEKHELWTLVAHGLEGQQIRIPSGRGLAGYVAVTGKTLNVKDAYRDSRFIRRIDLRTGYKTRTILSMPIKNKHGEIIGVFQILNKKHGCFTKDDEKLLEGVVSFAAIAIENARLYKQLKHQMAPAAA